MKTTLLVLCLIVAAAAAQAQPGAEGARRLGNVTIQPVYQNWSVEDGVAFSEFSSTVSMKFPVAKGAGVTLRSAHAVTAGDPASINGLSDTQLGGSYLWEKTGLMFSLGINLPSGKTELDTSEFRTSALISNTLFAMRVPGFGQGVRVNPGVIWAYPASANVVLGVGASYQYKAKFTPLSDGREYEPGAELTFTGGADFRLSQSASLSADVVFTTYGKDKFAGAERFAAGSKIVGNLQFRNYFGYNEFYAYARYRSKAKNEVAVAGILVEEQDKTEPDQVELGVQLQLRLNERFSNRIMLEGRFFEETRGAYSGASMFGAGMIPEITLSRYFSLPFRIKYQFGSLPGGTSLSGFEAGLGLTLMF